MRRAGKWAALLLAGSALAACVGDEAVNDAAATDFGNDASIDINAEMPMEMDVMNETSETTEEAWENRSDFAPSPPAQMAQPPDPPPVPPPPDR